MMDDYMANNLAAFGQEKQEALTGKILERRI